MSRTLRSFRLVARRQMTMPVSYVYEKRPWYPNMRPEDVAIWERFIDKFPDEYQKVSYDVLVGSPPPFDTNVNADGSGDDVRLYKKKIDVVGFRQGVTDIIEFNPAAGMSALGQIIGYVRSERGRLGGRRSPLQKENRCRWIPTGRH